MKKTERQEEIVKGIRGGFTKWVITTQFIDQLDSEQLLAFLVRLKNQPEIIKSVLCENFDNIGARYVMKTGQVLCIHNIKNFVHEVVEILSDYYSEELAKL